MNQFFPSSSQSIRDSASPSVLPMNTQDWSPLGWTGLISLQSKGLSRVFSITTVRKHQFFKAQLSLWSHSHNHTWLLEKPQLWLCRPWSAKWCLFSWTLISLTLTTISHSAFLKTTCQGLLWPPHCETQRSTVILISDVIQLNTPTFRWFSERHACLLSNPCPLLFLLKSPSLDPFDLPDSSMWSVPG